MNDRYIVKEIIGGYPIKRKVKVDDFETAVKKELKQLWAFLKNKFRWKHGN